MPIFAPDSGSGTENNKQIKNFKRMEQKPDTELEFIEKPIRKPDRRVLGRLESWDDSDFKQFVPCASGTGVKRTVMKSSGRAKLVKNEGEKESSYSLLANYKASDANFAEKMIEDVSACLKPHLKKAPKLPSAKFVYEEEGLKIWQSREKKRICVYCEIDKEMEKNLMSSEWGRLSYEISKQLRKVK